MATTMVMAVTAIGTFNQVITRRKSLSGCLITTNLNAQFYLGLHEKYTGVEA